MFLNSEVLENYTIKISHTIKRLLISQSFIDLGSKSNNLTVLGL